MSKAFLVDVYDKNFEFVGRVGNPISVSCTPQRYAAGISTVGVPADHKMVAELLKDGSRMWIRDFQTKDHLMSGWVADYRITGPERRSIVEFDIVDDFIVLMRMLGWVIPGAAITAQGDAGTNWELEDNAETVLKNAVQANGVDRLGLPIDIPTDLGRGSVVKGKLRFQTIYDRLIPVEDGAGIINSGIEIGLQQNPDAPGLRLNVWEPRTVTQTLTERAGVIKRWGLTGHNATLTRGVASGEGEGTLRLLREKNNAALEAAIGWKFEGYKDATQTDDPDTMYEAIDQLLLENGPRSGISVEFSEAGSFIARPGKIWIGDTVNMGLAGQTVTNKLNQVTISSTASDGKTTKPSIGDVSDSPDVKMAKIVRNIGRKLRLAGAPK